MKNSLSELYSQIILNEAEKHNLQNPGSDEVSNIKTKQDLFGSKPKPVEGPDKAKLQKGPSYKETTGEKTSAPKSSASSKGSMPKAAAGSAPKVDEAEEMEDTDVVPDSEEESDDETPKFKKKQPAEESFTMSAFETLFKKTITEEIGDESGTPVDAGDIGETGLEGEGPNDALDLEDEEEGIEEEEGDLVSDLKDLRDKLDGILAKLEDTMADEEDLEGEEYNEEDFDDEFSPEGEDEAMKESVDGPKPLGDKKKVLQHKKNKVGKLSAKGGKAHTGNLKSQPSPTALGDKKKHLQSKSNQVKTSIKKGEFIK